MSPLVPMSPEAKSAIQRLRTGNSRFVRQVSEVSASGWRPGLADGQRPFAVLLGCSDSRAPAELVFDQGLGDLFVIRVAGNIVAPSQVGSVEFAVSQFQTPLVVVMGHTHCGAVAATVAELENGETAESKNIESITGRIRPYVDELVRQHQAKPLTPERRAALLREAMRANVRASADHLGHGSALLERFMLERRVAIVGAELELETGEVTFLDLE